MKPRNHRYRFRVGMVNLANRGDGSGYRARCTACRWTDTLGDYVWNVTDRAIAHIEEAHERRKGNDRRTYTKEGA